MQKQTLTIGFCAPGSVESLFMNGVFSILPEITNLGIQVTNVTQVMGNMIHEQRQDLFEQWVASESDWLLILDSDIVVTPEVFTKLWQSVDSVKRPIVSGVYFLLSNVHDDMPRPTPSIFTADKHLHTPIHPLPEDQLIKVDAAGLGLVLMHKSIQKPLQKVITDGIYFDVKTGPEGRGEDFAFFRNVRAAGIPIYAHTGAIAQHVKRVAIGNQYYRYWWRLAQQLDNEYDKQNLTEETL